MFDVWCPILNRVDRFTGLMTINCELNYFGIPTSDFLV